MLLTDGEDQTLVSQVLDESSGNGSANLELLAKRGSGDGKDLGDLLEELLVLPLFKEDSVVKLFLDLNLGPGLLLSLGSALTSVFLL